MAAVGRFRRWVSGETVPPDLRITTDGRFLFNTVEPEPPRHAVSCRVTLFSYVIQRPTIACAVDIWMPFTNTGHNVCCTVLSAPLVPLGCRMRQWSQFMLWLTCERDETAEQSRGSSAENITRLEIERSSPVLYRRSRRVNCRAVAFGVKETKRYRMAICNK